MSSIWGKCCLHTSGVLKWRRATTAIALSLFLICEAMGATYYVDRATGSDQNSGLSLTAAWATLNKANATLVAGDTVYIRAGTYDQVIRPANSGASGKPITYKNYANEVVTVRGAVGQIAVVNLTSSYIVVDGLTLKHISPASHASPRIVLIYGDSYDHNTIRNCNIVCQGPGTYDGSREWGIQVSYADYCTIENNTISGWPVVGINIALGATYAVIRGNTLVNTQNTAIDLSAQSYGPHYTLIENNFIDYCYQEDGIQFEANYSQPLGSDSDSNSKVIIRNNIFRYCAENGIDMKGVCNVLIEGNIFYGISGDNEGPGDGPHRFPGASAIAHGADAGMRDIIIRNNILYDNQGGILVEKGVQVYNNVIVHNNRDYTGSNSSWTMTYRPAFTGIAAWMSRDYVNIKNNIIGGQNAADVAIRETSPSLTIQGNCYFPAGAAKLVHFIGTDNWHVETWANWPLQLANPILALGCDTASLNTDPKFVYVPQDAAGVHTLYDFGLDPSSPCIDAGQFLTTTTRSSSGTTMTVADSRYFCDGYGVVPGDMIQLQGQTATARIANINYSTHTLTLATPLSWTAGQGVSLPYHGASPDIGAREYGQTDTYMYSLLVSAVNGSVTKSPDHTSYAYGETVALEATPNAGYAFSGWSGDLTGTTNPATLVMDSNKSVTANFIAIGGGPTTTVGTTTVYSSITTDAPRRAMPYTMPENGQLQSISVYHQGGTGQVILAVYADNAGKPDARLGVTSATALSSTEGWQTIPLQSPVAVPAGQQIWLAWIFENNPGIRFVAGTPARAGTTQAWSGGMPATFGASDLRDYTYSIYATYSTESAATYTLTTSAANGTVTRTPDQTSYASGETVTLEAAPDAGYEFTGWSGDLTGTTNPATLVMDADKSVTANFAPITYTLTTSATNGTITRTPNQASYTAGETVTLEAMPDAGYEFTGWSGNLSGTTNPATLVMDANKSVTANFAPITYTLTTSATNGTVTRTPNKTSYTSGETVTLQATPDAGYAFTGWSGNLSGTANPATLVMDADKLVTANFAPVSKEKTVGTTTVYDGITTDAPRRAVPFTMPENGQLESVSIYHQGGAGRVILAVYADNAGKPDARLGVTSITAVSATEGWQMISLQSPAVVPSGQQIWLAWVFENNPGIRFTKGTPARADSRTGWSGGMPTTFGRSNLRNYTYSIYATYTTAQPAKTVGTTTVYDGISTDAPRRAVPFTMAENGKLQSLSIYHQGGSGYLILAVYGDNAGKPGERIGVASRVTVSSTQGWQTVPLQWPVSVSAGQQIWLAWVFENNPGIRFTKGTPARADSGLGWSGGMPTTFGPCNIRDYTYSIYATYD